MKHLWIISILLLTTTCNQKNIDRAEIVQNLIPGNIKTQLIEEQKEIISSLTGASNIEQSNKIKRRWNNEEKLLVRNFLSKKFENLGIRTQEHSYHVNLPEYNRMSNQNPYDGTNLYAILPASTPTNEYVLIGAHYDTVKESPGASDNATGCALIYGVSKLVSKLENRKRNLIIVFFDQEETGHAGSYAFVNFVKKNGYKIHSVHTADQVGWDKDKDRNIELELPTKYLESIYKKHASPFGINVYTTKVTSSDHKEWREAGYNAVGITEEYKHGDTSPHHHDPTDTFDTVDFDYLSFTTHLVFKVVEDLIIN